MATWNDVVTIASALPEVEETTSWNTPSLKVRGKLFARLRTEDDGGLVLACPADEKAAHLASGHEEFYTTPHYDGYDYILVRLDKIDIGALEECVVEAWLTRAPARLREDFAG